MLCTKSINGFTVFVSHPEDCSKFFICHGRRAFPIDCAAGTLFDKNLKICNHAYTVDCQKEPLKAATTTSKTIKTTTEIINISKEKTDPCLKLEIGINPRNSAIGLNPKCEKNLALTIKEPLKAAPTITETIKTTTETIKISKEKTDPCLKKGIGINPRNSAIGLDPKCEENLALTIKEPLKAAPTITETIKTTATKTKKTSDKTDPSQCLTKGIGIVPRDSSIDLDPKCEENVKTVSETDLTEDFDYIFVLKATPTTTEIIKTTVKEETTSSEKTDSSPCFKKVIGINPRDAILDLDSNCEENLTISKAENPPTPPLPPCKLDIRLGDPEYDDIIFDTEKCDPLPTDSAEMSMNK